MNKSDQAYKTIGEVVKILDLKTRSGQKNPTYTIRYWEKEFKQIKPKIFSGKRRYYDNETIKILGNYNDIEIRNSIVPYIYLTTLKKKGVDSVITGDGADEVFAGYNFLLKKSDEEIGEELKRIKKIMHFPSKDIARSLNMKVETPFLNEELIKFSDDIEISKKINAKDGEKFGKWILRETFEKYLPNNITWREKSPMQDGSGTNNLTGLFNTIITDDIFTQKKTRILEEDGVYIRTKESLHYYECFRKTNSVKKSDSDNRCPDCNHEIAPNSRFCRMCGKFPIN